MHSVIIIENKSRTLSLLLGAVKNLYTFNLSLFHDVFQQPVVIGYVNKIKITNRISWLP
uniref:Uncharacterized protein n=1 Tax=Lepeophtheirus salmonis TaxID=72036 RepID=A0A0K2TMG0_LEPSM